MQVEEQQDDPNDDTTTTTAAVASAAAVPSSNSNNNHNNHNNHVGLATYPIPQPLAKRLQLALLQQPPPHDDDAAAVKLDLESPLEALRALVGNSIQALDALYFSYSPAVRNHVAFQHRLCIRVATDVHQKTLTITDLGIGMTRADVINCLGIGRSIVGGGGGGGSSNRKEAVDDEDDEDDASSSSSTSSDSSSADGATDSTEEDLDEEDDEVAVGNNTNITKNPKKNDKNKNKTPATAPPTAAAAATAPNVVVSCKSTALGGFYAALCALGVGVTVGTKSKFDDYYIFQVGNTNNNTTNNKNSLDSFQIQRPFPEGTPLTASLPGGFDKLEAVRGESGTSVTLHLNATAIQAGLLEEQRVLKPMFLKIVETTQYTVAFSSDTQQAADIIQASIHEAEFMKQQQEQEHEHEQPHEQPTVTTTTTTTTTNTNVPPHPTLETMDTSSVEDADMEDVSSHHHRTSTSTGTSKRTPVKERAKYIPLRLSLGERKMLRLVEATMTCCDYTSTVDQPFSKPVRRTHAQLKGVTAVLRGLVTACDYTAGQALLDEKTQFSDYQSFFRQMLEIARRHKIMNPEKMRTEYGKLIYLLQDAVALQSHLGFSIKGPIHSVYHFLEERNGLAVLEDPLIEVATEEILAGPHKSRAKIDQEIRRKERAVQQIKKKYRTSKLSAEDIHLCLYSICDNNSFLNSNRVPIDKVIEYLTTHFSPKNNNNNSNTTTTDSSSSNHNHHNNNEYSLAIISGEEGARLSHSHERQYYFALQSLTLWRDIIDDMFRLWAMAEDDLLRTDAVPYSLQDTGQGMQRVQQCPQTYKAMQQILQRVQSKVQNWVGSSVIHMGDHNVPNALSFIDKYTQVPRILGPIVTCLEVLEQLVEKDEGIQTMINQGFGGLEKLRKDILYDFFRSAFDGSGADNFYDAGSCIDGRLTSAWNWCSQLPEKPFYPIFKLTGFIGFDGEFH